MKNNLDEFLKYVKQNKYNNIDFILHLCMYVEFYRNEINAVQDKEQAAQTNKKQSKPLTKKRDCGCEVTRGWRCPMHG